MNLFDMTPGYIHPVTHVCSVTVHVTYGVPDSGKQVPHTVHDFLVAALTSHHTLGGLRHIDLLPDDLAGHESKTDITKQASLT